METQGRCHRRAGAAAERGDRKTLDQLKRVRSATLAVLGSFVATGGECRKQGRWGNAMGELSPEVLDRLIVQIGAARGAGNAGYLQAEPVIPQTARQKGEAGKWNVLCKSSNTLLRQ